MTEPRWKWTFGAPPERSSRKPMKQQQDGETACEWRQKTSKREDTNFRLEARDALISNGDNPFRPGSCYTQDICMQDRFLRPGPK